MKNEKTNIANLIIPKQAR